MSYGGVDVGNAQEDRVERKEYLRVRIDLPALKLDINTQNPSIALSELRRILEAMHLDEEVIYEEFVASELKQVFSETFVNHPKVMDVIRGLLKQEDDYRLATTEIATNATLDLHNGTKTVRVHQRDVKHAIANITQNIDSNRVKQGIIHLSGELDKNGKLLIVDHIHKYMPTAQLRAFHSKGTTGNVIIECIFFGDFPEED